jgi:hypothetical protein
MGNSFEVTNDKKAIPKFIRTQLACLANGFSIANPDQRYQASDLFFKRLPNRQLVYLATNDSMMVMTYQRGGFVAYGHVLLIKFRNKEVTHFWAGNCLTDVYRLKTKESIIDYFKSATGSEMHGNTIHF